MHLRDSYIVCTFLDAFHQKPKFYKVHEIIVKNALRPTYGYILENADGTMEKISEEDFKRLSENMNHILF